MLLGLTWGGYDMSTRNLLRSGAALLGTLAVFLVGPVTQASGAAPGGQRALATLTVPGSATTTREATQTPAGGHSATLDKEDQRPHCWRQYNAACEQERRENDRKAHRDDNGY